MSPKAEFADIVHPAWNPEAAEPDFVERPSVRAWFILLVLVVATLFGFVDRQILVVLAESIKYDLRLTDSQLGMIQGLGPGLLAAPGVMFLGWLCDRMPRQLLLGISVVVWSIATAACALTHSFHGLVLSTIAIGLGEAALGPIVYSVLPDIFPGRSRLTANMIYYGASTVGAGFGIAFASSVVSFVQAHGADLPSGLNHLPAWRIAFIAAAAPGIPLAAIIAGLGVIPRVSAPTAEPSHNTLTGYLRRHWRAFTGLLASMWIYGMGMYAIYAWAPIYIIRLLGASPAAVGFGFGAALTCSGLLGVVTGAISLRRLSRTMGRMAPVRIFQIGMFAAALPVPALLFATRPWEAYVLIGASLGCITIAVSMVPTLLQDLSPPQVRGRLLSIVTLLFLVATGAAPILVGFISDQMPSGSRGLLWAIVGITAPAFLAAGVILRCAEAAFRRTMDELTAVGSEPRA